MYLGSSVPHITKDGLQGIQEPLRELYPDKSTLESGNAGIDSWLSVWSNGILLENVDETGREVKRFFKIDALHYCAAVKFVPMPIVNQQQQNPYAAPLADNNPAAISRFLPLDSPYAGKSNQNPPIFASILRRTTGIKVLECHAFICRRDGAANALVRCCFHAYADTMYAKQIGADVSSISSDINNNQNHALETQTNKFDTMDQRNSDHSSLVATRRSKSIAALNGDHDRSNVWQPNGANDVKSRDQIDNSNYVHQDRSSVARRRSVNEHHAMNNCDNSEQIYDGQQMDGESLRKHHKFSKSMHHLNQAGQLIGRTCNQPFLDQPNNFDGYPANQSSAASCISTPSCPWPPQPFYNPHGSRVPSYPPQNLLDASNNGGTMRSIKSLAANSIASTLLRSKKHAKAMSIAQLNQDKITSFHQPHSNAASTMGGPMMVMPPVPPMFLPNLQGRTILSGSQTMQTTGRPPMPVVGSNINYETMTPKEMKKLLKKGAKYGIDPTRFSENGLPMMHMRPPPGLQSCPIPLPHDPNSMIPQTMIPDVYIPDLSDMVAMHGLPPPPLPRGVVPEMDHQSSMKPILVKPNPEFLKSKAGKKWLKQQKEFKKLLPPHLEGLPIIFGPPPVEALDPIASKMHQPAFVPPTMPMMDSSGYYNPHPFYGQSGRISAASTLIRHSPHSQVLPENYTGPASSAGGEYLHRNQSIYSNTLRPTLSHPNQRDYGPGGGAGDDSSAVYANSLSGGDRRPRHPDERRHRSQRRNHMVEQSVISLDDENDCCDEDDERQQASYYSQQAHEAGPQQLRRPKSSQMVESVIVDRNKEHITTGYRESDQSSLQGCEQSMQQADDQCSYSSGIYKRGHINERAFSYSIRQEHKLSNGIETEYSSPNETTSDNSHQLDQDRSMIRDNQQHPSNIYQEQQDRYYRDNNESQTLPVNELTARLENQLNMKSFSNSRIKSQM